MDEDYYGKPAKDNEQKTVQERCREYYAIGDFVVVMNIDTNPFAYQVQRVENQSFDQPDTVHMNITNVKNPERITMQPGETRLVPAYEADLMIKALMDKIVYANRGKIISESGTPKESVSDPDTQRKYISSIYQGKRDFMQEYNDSLKKPDVSGDLEDEPTRPTKVSAK
jgi:hypothetical protein